MYQSLISFPRALAGLFATLLCLSACYLRAADVPASAAVGGPTTYPGGSLKGEYWKRTPVSILTDGVGNRADGIDNQIATFGTPDGTFKATVFTYLGNDLTQVQTWLGADGASYSGISSNLDDGAFRLTGFINVAAPGPITLGTTSDDGARIKVGGVDISNGDGSHGDETHDADANFAAAGLYPIEVTYFNGDWTSDGNNHSGSTDPGLHGGANLHVRVGGADVTPSVAASLFYPAAPRPQVAVGIHFGADDPPAPATGSPITPDQVAGAVAQKNWNNLTGASGTSQPLVADTAAGSVPTTITVTWACPNTWSSTGRGEENNGFPAGGDRSLMTGYLDTGNGPANTATVTVDGIPADFSSGGYDVLVYCVGGVAGRGGAYTINGETKYGTGAANPATQAEDPGVDVNDTGTYVRFRGLFGSSFTLVSSADAAIGAGLVNFRAPINGIQIVRNPNPDAGLAVGYLLKHRYENLNNSVDVNALLTDPKYINDQFDFACLRSDFSANDGNECNNCGFVVRGFFTPKASGPHTFYMSSDDGGALFLSTDDTPANKVIIAREPLWSGPRSYTGPGDGGGRGDPPANVSVPINLAAGSRYYIEGVVKEAGGGDNLDVAVQGPGDPTPVNGDRALSGDRISTFVDLTGSSLSITQNPAAIRVPEGDAASFSVGVAAVSPLCGGTITYQWQRNGVDIPGANLATYSFGPVRPEDHLATFAAVVRIPGITRVSTSARLEVLGRECLRVVAVIGSGDLLHATVQFSTFLDPAVSANTDALNFEIAGPGGSVLPASVATLNGDGKSVTLTTDPQTENTLYTVTVLPDTITSVVGTTVCAPPTNSGSFTSWVTDPCGGLVFESFFNITGTPVANLTSAAAFPNSPDERLIMGVFDTRSVYPDDSHENYGGRVRGLFIPPASGNWIFYLASDDASQLFFNANGPSAAGKVLIQQETGCCGAWAGHASAPQALVGGHPYYIEVLYKEGGGGDFAKVAAGLQGQPAPTDSPTAANVSPNAIPGAWLGYPAAPPGIGGPITITQQPAPQNVPSGSLVTMSVGASNPNDLPICYQWTRNGVDIPGATGPSYRFGPVTVVDDNNTIFAVRVGVIGSQTVSANALLNVFTDTVRPTAVSATAGLSLSSIVVKFSELMTGVELGDSVNYSVPGFTITSVTTNADGLSATIALDGPLAIGATYSIVINSITDLSGNPINPDPTTLTVITPVKSCGFVREDIYLNIGGGVLVSDLTSAPKYPNSPDIIRYKDLVEANIADEFDSYGIRFSGWLVPPVSGSYNFFMSSDDGGAFYLSTDANPAHLALVAAEPVWNGRRDWVGLDRRDTNAPENRSTTLFPGGIQLVAGQQYYFEALEKEGGGGDNLAVAWQKPGDPLPALGSSPIPGAYILSLGDPSAGSLAITTQPVGQSVLEGAAASFSVAATATLNGAPWPNPFYQWSRKSPGGAWTVIQGANAASYNIASAQLSDNGAQYRVLICSPGQNVTSAEVTLNVRPINPNTCPVATGANVTVNAGSSVSFNLNASDLDGDPLQFSITQAPAHGIVVVQVQTGAATYTPAAGYTGPDLFKFKANDGHCDSQEATVNINVRSANTAPHAQITASPLVDFSPAVANKVVISCNGSNACLLLDGSLSSDAESPLSQLTFHWSIVPLLPFATGVTATECLELGTPTILLTVTDPGGLSGTDSLTVDVVSAGEAIGVLIEKINSSVVARKNKRPFIATLKAAAASADRGQPHTAANQLHALQNKIRAQIAPGNPAEAALWTRWAQNIIDALNACE